MKKTGLFMLVTCVLLLVACAKQDIKDDNGEARDVDHFKITIEKDSVQPALKENKLVKLNFKVKNTGKVDFAIGASDFYIKDEKGKKHEINGSYPNFGNDIKVGGVLEGSGYFQLPENVKNISVFYQPFKNNEAEWFIALPKTK
ncbi:DUF4352 domain-containing protein [Carnobacterium maltaromaticum]|nr:DUF4352 domain-containing protein [Carnobacterium maltaromaticum]